MTNGKPCGSIVVVVRKSNQCEIEPQGNSLPCGSLRLGRIETLAQSDARLTTMIEISARIFDVRHKSKASLVHRLEGF